MSPRKVRLIVDLVRGMKVVDARAQLQVNRRAAALPVLKALESAVANAVHNKQLNPDNLFIKTIKADQGPTIHRYRPRAFGRAGAIRKRTTHLTIVLDEKSKS